MHSEHELRAIISSKLAEQVKLGALRLLHSIDLVPNSRTYGVADREYWAWKTKDFANGTWQAGLSGLLDAQALLELTPGQLERATTALLEGCAVLQRSNGSFEEAFPFESSVAVTGLVLFNVLYAYRKHRQFFNNRASALVRQVSCHAMRFLTTERETHGMIANHRAAVLLCHHLWPGEFGEEMIAADWAQQLAGLFEKEEGWFPEYGGADPGYQTLLNHFLLAASFITPLPSVLAELVPTSVAFCRLFCFPDGTFAGEVGARGTSIAYPTGILESSHATSVPSFEWLGQYLLHVETVTPTAVDAGNFAPVFNSWSLLYALHKQLAVSTDLETTELVDSTPRIFNKARIIVAKSAHHFCVVALHNGCIRAGVEVAPSSWSDRGVAAYLAENQSTQFAAITDINCTSDRVSFRIFFRPEYQPLSGPFLAICLRIVSVLVYWFPLLHSVLKKVLAYVAMRKPNSGQGPSMYVGVDLSSQPLSYHGSGIQSTRVPYGFRTHMASANYFSVRALE